MRQWYRLDRFGIGAGRALLMAAALCGCEPEGTHTGTCRVALVTALPFRAIAGHLVVDARINGMPVALMFDTGAATTVLTDQAVKRLRLRTEFDRAGEIEGIGGSRTMSVVHTTSFELGALHGKQMSFVQSGIVFSGREIGIDGTLSTDFLSKYDIDLDIPDNKIIMYYPLGDCHAPAAALGPPLYDVNLIRRDLDSDPRVDVVIGAQHLVAAIDTGSPRTTIFRGPAVDLGLTRAVLENDPHGMIGGVGPDRVRAVRHVFAPIAIGDIEIQHLPVAVIDQRRVGDTDMLLGMDFVSRVHL